MTSDRIKARGVLTFYLTAEGPLSLDRAERMALFMADGLTPPQAWKNTGGGNTGGSFEHRKKIEAHPAFIERLAVLKKEKEDLMADDLFGEAKWMAQQMWREGRVSGNTTLMAKALDARMKIMEKEEARSPTAPAQVGAIPQGRPGRPSIENPQTSAATADIKARLMARGVVVPGSVPSSVPTPSPAADPPPPPAPAEAFNDDFAARLEAAVPG